MKLIIAGGRDYYLTEIDYEMLNIIHREYGVTEVLSGCATGADTCGEQWAKRNGILVSTYPAMWRKHGKAAGMMRNGEMAEAGNALAVFPGGKGTANMLKQAQERGLRVFDFRI